MSHRRPSYLNGDASNATLAAIAEAYPEDPTQVLEFPTLIAFLHFGICLRRDLPSIQDF